MDSYNFNVGFELCKVKDTDRGSSKMLKANSTGNNGDAQGQTGSQERRQRYSGQLISAIVTGRRITGPPPSTFN